jgi:Dual-action HEIGH metallo-peptidase
LNAAVVAGKVSPESLLGEQPLGMGQLVMFRKMCVASALVVFGCSGESEDTDIAALEQEEAVLEIVDNLVAAGYPDGEIEVHDDGRVFVGGDAHVTLAASREMIGLATDDEHDHGDRFRQYRTTNQVGGGVAVICIDGSSLNGTLSTGLNNAITNYNALNLQFDFLRTSGNDAGCDAEITIQGKGAAGGISGFPSGGLPYDQIQVGKSTANYGLAVVTHVIEHEIGHCIGLRHTDYYNRSISCGVGGNEGDGGVGAIQIAGTPSTAVLDGSVFNSCFHNGSTGVFTGTDITALGTLY